MERDNRAQDMIFERILESLKTIAEMSARLILLENVVNKLDKIVSSGNGMEPLTIQMVRINEGMIQIKASLDKIDLSYKKVSAEEIIGKWNLRKAIVDIIPALIGGSLVVIVTKYFGK